MDNNKEKEVSIWYEFYMKFNDDNFRHADNAFYNNGLADEDSSELHGRNVEWVKEIIEHGVSTEEEICRIMSNAKPYVEEYYKNEKKMLKEKIIEKMEKRGFTRIMESRNRKDETTSITFTNNMPDAPWYSVTVWVEDMEFEFVYCMSTSINKLVSPRCGSFMNDEHFTRLARKFEREVVVLHEHFG